MNRWSASYHIRFFSSAAEVLLHVLLPILCHSGLDRTHMRISLIKRFSVHDTPTPSCFACHLACIMSRHAVVHRRFQVTIHRGFHCHSLQTHDSLRISFTCAERCYDSRSFNRCHSFSHCLCWWVVLLLNSLCLGFRVDTSQLDDTLGGSTPDIYDFNAWKSRLQELETEHNVNFKAYMAAH
jgi:hypothetical protein